MFSGVSFHVFSSTSAASHSEKPCATREDVEGHTGEHADLICKSEYAYGAT